MVTDDDRRAMITDDDRRAMITNDHRFPMISDDDRRAMIANDGLLPMIADHRTATAVVAVTGGRRSGCGNKGEAGRERDGNSGQCGDDRYHGKGSSTGREELTTRSTRDL